jgi:O-antigen/teichoic acid export membrane protein
MTDLSTKRVAFNTVMLYLRMVVLMCVNLFTSRIILNALGVEDYGLYTVVGGIVIFLGFINLSMTASSQRFLSFEQGRGNADSLRRMFCSVFIVHVLLAAAIFIIGEPIGIFYISNYLNVAPDKLSAAYFVFQFSLLSFILKTITVPYHSSIIANEKMQAFAYISIAEGGLQLTAALVTKYVDANKLYVYSGMMFLSVLVVQSCYLIYSRRHFQECRVSKDWDKDSIREIFAYSGWNLFGSFSSVAISQGMNMVLNFFYGVVINAAQGIASQVTAAVSSLAGNLQQAINPQIVKTYASGDKERNVALLSLGTRIGYSLLLLMAMPVLFNITKLLYLWLGQVPQYATTFCYWTIAISLLAVFSNSLITGVMATGKIKVYQIVVSCINISNLPIAYILFKHFDNPYISLYTMFSLGVIAFVARLTFASRMLAFPMGNFIKRAVLPCVVATALSVICSYGICCLIPDAGLLMLAVRILLIVAVTAIAISITILSNSERKQVIGAVKSKLK